MAPSQKPIKVPSEFEGLAGHRVAVVIYADQQVQYEYPYARLNLSSAILGELTQRVKDVTVIDPRRVIRYQIENVHWDTLDKTQLGKDFGADYVLFVVLESYTMREPGSVNLYRGQIRAHAGVFQTTLPEPEARVWKGEDFRVIYPRHAPTGQPGRDDSEIRYQTEKLFAEAMVRKFYKHEVLPADEN